MKDTNALLKTVKETFERENFMGAPEELYAPIDYTLRLGGKRIRPVLLLAANQMFGGNESEAMNGAIGIEVFHNFTLLHDDLMDKSPIRRGKPTVYRKWNENAAILSGDTMFAMAWKFFLRQPHPRQHEILNFFCRTAMEVCEGQQLDMNYETRSDVSIADYMEMIRLKTAVLLAGALKLGALYAGAPEKDMEHLYQLGINLGLAFQLQDDLLDAYGDVKVFGKQTGSDICDNKKTYLVLLALQQGNNAQHETLSHLFSTTPADPTEKIAQVLDIYQDLDIRSQVSQAIESEFSLAQQELAAIAVSDDQKIPLQQLMQTLLGREI